MTIPAKPGDLIADRLTTRVFNNLTKNIDNPNHRSLPPAPHNPAIVQASGAFAADVYDPVNIVGPKFPNEGTANDLANPYYRYPTCEVNNTLVEPRWCVLQDYLNTNQPSFAVLQGLTWVRANITNLTHTHVTVIDGELVSGSSGRASIITPPAATGVGLALILLGGGSGFVGYKCVLTSAMSTGTGTADIFDLDTGASVETGASIKVGMRAFLVSISGDEGWCWKQGDHYRIGNIECPGTGGV